MAPKMRSLSPFLLLATMVATCLCDSFSDYPPVDLGRVAPTEISWNQVHYLVRENLLEIESLKRENEAIYREMQKCHGLQRCLGTGGLLNMVIGDDGALSHGAGSLLREIQRLQRERERLEGTANYLEAEMRERRRQEEYRKRLWMEQQEQQRRQQQEQYGSSHWSNSSMSYGSTMEAGGGHGGGRGGGGGGSSQSSYEYHYEYSSRSSSGGGSGGDTQQYRGYQEPARNSYSYERQYQYRYGGENEDGPVPGRG